jgi:hypothetical protein
LALTALFGSLGAAVVVALGTWVYRRFFEHRLP